MRRVRRRCEGCGQVADAPLPPGATSLACGAGCGREVPARSAPAAGASVERCAVCPSRALYAAKDFPRALGLGVVVVAAVLAPFTMYLSLLAAAAIDGALFLLLGDVAVCYACKAEHRGFPRNPAHKPYDIHLAEPFQYGGSKT